MAKRMDKQKILHVAKNLFFIIVGCFLLAFGDAAFIEPLGLVTGGIISVGVIIQHFVTTFQIVDIVTWALQIILLVVSWFFLGKKFTLHTLLASLLYPLFFTLLYRIPIVDGLSIGRAIAAQLMQPLVAESGSIVTNYALTLLGGIAGILDCLCPRIARRTNYLHAVLGTKANTARCGPCCWFGKYGSMARQIALKRDVPSL